MVKGNGKYSVIFQMFTKFHPGIKTEERRLGNKFNEKNFFQKDKYFFKSVTPPEIENLLDANQAAGIDTIPPKLELIFQFRFSLLQ